MENRTFEHITWNIIMNKRSLSITGIYCLPSKDSITKSMFIDDIRDHLTSVLSTTQRNLILGDSNIHVDGTQDNDALVFKDTMMAPGLDSHVNSSTHIHGSKLDLVFAEAGSDLTVSPCTTGIFISDHKLVTAIKNIRKLKLERKLGTIRKMNCDGLLDSMAKNLNTKLRRVLDTLAPEQTQTVLARPKQPWYT